jgi:hypothetical protein
VAEAAGAGQPQADRHAQGSRAATGKEEDDDDDDEEEEEEEEELLRKGDDERMMAMVMMMVMMMLTPITVRCNADDCLLWFCCVFPSNKQVLQIFMSLVPTFNTDNKMMTMMVVMMMM